MRLSIAVALGWLIAACSSHSTSSLVDAAVHMDGAGSACTGAVFDPCTDNTQCMSGICHLYMMANIQVCTTACTAGNNSTCPLDSTGANGTCNNMGICKPAKANPCTR